MIVSRYTHLFFDADNTLFDFNQAEQQALINTLLEFNVILNPELNQLYTETNKQLWKQVEQGIITFEDVKRSRFKPIVKHLDLPITAIQMNERYQHHLSMMHILFEQTYEVVERLADKYTLMIITNGLAAVQNKRILASTIYPFLHQVYISEEIGHQKPDPAFFDYILQEQQLSPEQILIIGDSLMADIQGGMNSGIDTCWFNATGQDASELIIPTYEIKTLNELLVLI